MLALQKLTKETLPRFKWQKVSDRVLGPDYDLSLVFASDELSQKLHREHKGKDTPTNVLSFPLGKDAGEIFLNPSVAKREAKLFGETAKNRLIYLLIHGCLHLKGLTHGSRMDAKEKEFSQIFLTTNVKTPHHRIRRGNKLHPSGGVRGNS